MTAAAKTRRIHGIASILIGVLGFSGHDVIMKWISGSYPLHEVILVRSLVGILVTLVILRFDGGLAALKSSRPGLHLMRGLLVVASNTSFYLGLAALPLSEVTALWYVAPLMISALSVPLLGEKVGPLRSFAIVAGLAGVVLVMRPGAAAFDPAALLPVLAALFYALMQMITRRLGVTDRASTMAFYIHILFVVVSLTIGFSVGDGRFAGTGHASLDFLLRGWVWPDRGDALLMLATGAIAGVSGFAITQAYRLAEAGVVAPFEYAALPASLMWGSLVFGYLPDAMAVAGIVLIAGSGLFVFYREAVHHRLVAARRPMPRNR